MNEASINNAIKELERMTDLLRKISRKEITQKQAADQLGITPQNFSGEIKNSFSNYIKKNKILTEDLLYTCIDEIETPCEKIAKDIFGILEDKKLVIVDTENQDLFLQRMEEILSEREMGVMRLRYGIDTGKQMSLQEVGKQFGVHQERIRQIVAKSLRKLRNPANCRLLLPNYHRYAKALQSCQEVRSVSENLDGLYNRANLEYNWILHRKEIAEFEPEVRKKLEHLVQISDMAIPEDWKKILISKGIITVFDYMDADHAVLDESKEFCPDFSCAIIDAILGIPAQDPEKANAMWDIPISELNLSTRTFNALNRARIDTLGDLAKKSRKEVMKIRNFGRSCYEELELVLAKYNITLIKD